jgi:hypothetical protein
MSIRVSSTRSSAAVIRASQQRPDPLIPAALTGSTTTSAFSAADRCPQKMTAPFAAGVHVELHWLSLRAATVDVISLPCSYLYKQ